METAIDEALKAKSRGEYAIGAVIVQDNLIIAQDGNRTRELVDPTAHAERLVITKTCQILGERHPKGCILYSTHEPCPMCATAAVLAETDRIVFGARLQDMQDFANTHGNEYRTWRTVNISTSFITAASNIRPILTEEFMREECLQLFHCD